MIDSVSELIARLSAARAAKLDNANAAASTRLTALVKSVQVVTITATGLTTTATITSVNTAKAVVIFASLGTPSGQSNQIKGRGSLTNSTTVTLTVGANNGQAVTFYVVEFF